MKTFDGGQTIDWGRISGEYARYRPGYPESFHRRIFALGIGLPGQRILDLGTGTGVLARRFARDGCHVTGVDSSPIQIETARELAQRDRVTPEFLVRPAEDTGLPERSFDVVTAAQSWLYFDGQKAAREVKRVLIPEGRLMTCFLVWLPRQDEIARRSEELILQFNPEWSGKDWDGYVPPIYDWAKDYFDLTGMFWYDEALEFTRESWRGRMRACRGTGVVLDPERLRQFDEIHDRLLREIAGERFTVLHRIAAHILKPK